MTLEADNSKDATWWADAAFAVHPDMKSHAGGLLSYGKGAMQTMSRKQKLNAKSSTQAKVFGADDVSSNLLWIKCSMEAQGCKQNPTLMQDNASAILLEKNGCESAGKQSRHIDIRHFHIEDCYERQELDVKCCPTEKMTADHFTKPLQGKKFHEFGKMIVNLG